MLRSIILALIANLTLAGTQTHPQGFANTTYGIRGVVVTSRGVPVPGAQVWAFPVPTSGRGIAGDFFPVNADADGHFVLRLSPGRYAIRAKSDRAGYPNPDATLSSDPTAHFPAVTVHDKNISGIIVRLGRKGAFLQGSVHAAGSRAVVPNATVTLRGAHNSEAVVILTCNKLGQFQYVVPSKPITISVAAPGYRIAHFNAGKPVTFAPGEHRTVSFGLVRQ